MGLFWKRPVQLNRKLSNQNYNCNEWSSTDGVSGNVEHHCTPQCHQTSYLHPSLHDDPFRASPISKHITRGRLVKRSIIFVSYLSTPMQLRATSLLTRPCENLSRKLICLSLLSSGMASPTTLSNDHHMWYHCHIPFLHCYKTLLIASQHCGPVAPFFLN